MVKMEVESKNDEKVETKEKDEEDFIVNEIEMEMQ